MLSSYQGYIENNIFTSKDNIKIAGRKRVIITILDDEPVPTQKIISELEKRAKAIDSLNGIIPPSFSYSIEEIRDERLKRKMEREG